MILDYPVCNIRGQFLWIWGGVCMDLDGDGGDAGDDDDADGDAGDRDYGDDAGGGDADAC